MKNILIVSFHFYPDREVGAKRPSELAIQLKQQGYNVDVIAAKTRKDAELLEKIQGIPVCYIPPPPDVFKKLAHMVNRIKYRKSDNNHNSVTPAVQVSHNRERLHQRVLRILNSIIVINNGLTIWCFMVLTVCLMKKFRKDYSLVITSGPPMAVHHVGYFLKKILGIKWIMDLRDPLPVIQLIYPDKKFINSKARSNLRTYIELKVEKLWITNADLIIVTSPGAKDEINSRHKDLAEKIHVVFNGYDRLNKYIKKTKTDKLTMVYAGTLYFNRDPFPLLEGLNKLVINKAVDENRIQIQFYGDCESWNDRSLVKWVAENKLQKCVRISPPVGVTEIFHIMCDADILINFCQGQPMQIPAKTYEYMSTGKDSLTITEYNSDTALVVMNSETGTIIDPENDDIAGKLLEIYNKHFSGEKGLNHNKVKIEKYSRAYQNTRYIELISGLLH